MSDYENNSSKEQGYVKESIEILMNMKLEEPSSVKLNAARERMEKQIKTSINILTYYIYAYSKKDIQTAITICNVAL